MANILHCCSVGPDDGSCIVIVYKGGFCIIKKWSSRHVKSIGEVADTDSNFGTFTGGKNFGFAGTKRCLVLTDCFPRYGTPHTVEDGSTHAAEFEKGDCNIVRNGIPDLGAPAGVTVGCHAMFLTLLWRYGVRKGFNVRFIWLMEIHVDGLPDAGGEGYAKVMDGMDILEDIESGFHVAGGWMHEIGG